MAIYDTREGQWLRDDVKSRARCRCEWCWLRGMGALHHRTYETYGTERLGDVMAVCNACHKMIHDLWPVSHQITVLAVSLAAKGDPGLGHNAIWAEYLKNPRPFVKPRHVPNPDYVPHGNWLDDFTVDATLNVFDACYLQRAPDGELVLTERAPLLRSFGDRL